MLFHRHFYRKKGILHQMQRHFSWKGWLNYTICLTPCTYTTLSLYIFQVATLVHQGHTHIRPIISMYSHTPALPHLVDSEITCSHGPYYWIEPWERYAGPFLETRSFTEHLFTTHSPLPYHPLTRYEILDADKRSYWILDTGFWILHTGCWMLDTYLNS